MSELGFKDLPQAVQEALITAAGGGQDLVSVAQQVRGACKAREAERAANPEKCRVCHGLVEIQIRRGTRICCRLCEIQEEG